MAACFTPALLQSQAFTASVAVDSTSEVVGPSNAMVFRITTNRPANVRLLVTADVSGEVVLRDSAAISGTGELAVFGLDGAKPRFVSGTYRIAILVRDETAGDSVHYGYRVEVTSAPLTLLPPSPLDARLLLPVRSGRPKALRPTIAIGAAVLALSVVRGGGNISGSTSTDVNGVGLGALLGVSAFAIARRDPGRVLPENIVANEAYLRAYRRYESAIRGENRRRLDHHRTTFRLVAGSGQ